METASLPDEITAMLAPAVSATRDLARHGAGESEHRRISRLADAAARGAGGGDYLAGARTILRTAFPDRFAVAPERTCRCTEQGHLNESPDCQGDCDPCDDDDCSQCHPQCDNGSSCCGWCSDCETHHDDSDQDEAIWVSFGDRDRRLVCTSCEHGCEYV